MRIDRIVISLVLLSASAAVAQTADPVLDPSAPAKATTPPPPGVTGSSDQAEPAGPKQPEAGDFDAGGQVRLPNGPDAMGQYATYNWIALDLKGRYYITKDITVDGYAPLAVHHPDALMDGTQPKMIGGLAARFEAKLPKLGHIPLTPRYDTELALRLDATYMHERAMLLSDKDFPLFTGNFAPGFAGGLRIKLALSSVVDFAFTPSFVYQASGQLPAVDALQVPTSLVVKLGSLVKVAADAGVYTGDDFTIRASGGGRITAGGSLDVKLGPIVTHLGAGVASLLPGGVYPTIRDSVYLDLNVKLAK
jgi:hypothetical protein